ncbi:MalY/PatB family protein [Brevibacillus choshinensis]|uniref:cysteine-S-conjugate beta-lyase n=1 Tax=Brevibacillus choshinensis TaxID=54911 RepID=A0ABX7FVI3_BRECH|nr:MalY/PatB family protein [Brevibacillus choshinensis]QRG69728.1 pyridoxal phosphate-dependent aminotransferase [Brevibacillus choshinensis]
MYDFDKRIDRTGTNSVKWETSNPDVNGEGMLPLWVADMDFACPPAVTEALIKRATHPIYGYPMKQKVYYEALQEWIQKRYGASVEQSWMTSVAGVVPGIHVAIDAFTAPEDKVLIQTPVYHPFAIAIENRGRQVVRSSLLEREGQYEMDWDDLAQKLCDERVKLMILCSPHNPVGRVWTRQELERLGSLCVENGVIVISDEIHADLVYEKGSHTPFYTLSPQIAEQSVTFHAASKTFNLAGLFTSYMLTPNTKLLKSFNQMAGKMGNEHINLFGMEAAVAAYRHGEEWLDELLVYLHGNAVYLHEFLKARIPQVTMNIPQATYLGWMDFRKLGLEPAELNRLLRQKAKLGLNDGAGFGTEGEGFQRINFACPRSLLVEAMERLEKAIHS